MRVFFTRKILTGRWLRERRTLGQRPTCAGYVAQIYRVHRHVRRVHVRRWPSTIERLVRAVTSVDL